MESVVIIEPNSGMSREICNLLIRTISESCEKDHHNDSRLLEEWLANKTPENVKLWLEANKSYCAILDSGEIAGVLQISPENQILLNYVAPKYLGKGIGTKMLQRLEKDLGEGICVSVETSETAKEFYRQKGFKEVEGNSNKMSKQISR